MTEQVGVRLQTPFNYTHGDGFYRIRQTQASTFNP